VAQYASAIIIRGKYLKHAERGVWAKQIGSPAYCNYDTEGEMALGKILSERSHFLEEAFGGRWGGGE